MVSVLGRRPMLLLFGVALLVAACSSDPESPQMTWGGPRNIAMLPLIAQEYGYFEANGLHPAEHNIQTGKLTLDALRAGQLDIGILVDSNVAFAGFDSEPGFRVVASIARKWDDAIVARRDAGITSPQDLRGKTIGVPFGTTAHVFAARYVAALGIADSVDLINQPPPSIQAGLLSGDLDAGAIWQPFVFNLETGLADRGVVFTDQSTYEAFALVAVRNDFAESNADAVDAFLQALIESEAEVAPLRLSPAQNYLAGEIGIAPEALTRAWEKYDIRVGLPSQLTTLLQEEGAWIVATQPGYEDRIVPAYERLVDAAFLERVAPERVE